MDNILFKADMDNLLFKAVNNSTSELTLIEPYEYLIFGYIRECRKKYRLFTNFPPAISCVVLSYYPTLLQYKGVFTAKKMGRKLILHSETLIEMKGYINSAKLSIPISVTDVNCYYWYMRMFSDSKQNGYHFIGVTTNNATTLENAALDGLIDCYGIAGVRKHIYYGTKNRVTNIKDCNLKIVDNIVRLEYYGVSKMLKFSLVSKKPTVNTIVITPMYTMQLPERADITEWWPTVSIANSGNKCEIIHNLQNVIDSIKHTHDAL